MHKAIKALIVTPQKYFRVFLNGSLILGGLGGGAYSTSCMIGEAFENVFNGVIQADGGQQTSNFLHLVTEAISGSGLLDRLLEVQKLDNIDIEGAIYAYYNLVCQPCIACRDLGGEKLSARYANLHSMSSDESLKIVRDYLIAATAKDLSLMISFRTREDRDVESPYNGVFLDSANQSFEYKSAATLRCRKERMKQERLQALGVKELQSNPVKMLLMLETLLDYLYAKAIWMLQNVRCRRENS